MDRVLEIINSPYSNIFTGLLAILTLSRLIKNAFINVKKAKACRYWPTTDGIILSSRVTSYKDKENTKMYQLDFKYTYQVNGIIYTSNSRYLDEENSQSWIGKLQDFVDNNKPQQQIPVYFDPENPSTSVVLNKTKFRYHLILIAYALFALFSLAILINGVIRL
ncbi:DUF3592 domain-containing protein [Carboxylicivirga sp. RSCT41]|uniref:DUF3592 domain-containing protein n=1 Tax=Carboxylicivirga agarovorans TaxID=3417570 RepID=UPI003D339479